MKASDRDSRENAFLRYEITGGNNKQLFTINHYTGLLAFTRVVTHQDAGSYDLAFSVMDSGTPVMSATTNMTLVLTVSNKTSNLLNVMHRQTSGRIHIHLLIGIVLIGVTVAVPITAAVSICLIRWKNQKNSLQRGGENISEKHITEQRHLMCHAHPDMPWPDVQGNRTEPELGRNSHSTKSKRGIYPGDQLEKGQRCSVRGMKCQTGSAVIYQEVGGTACCGEGNGKRHNQCKILSSHIDSEDGWSDGDATMDKTHQLPDLFSTECFDPNFQQIEATKTSSSSSSSSKATQQQQQQQQRQQQQQQQQHCYYFDYLAPETYFLLLLTHVYLTFLLTYGLWTLLLGF